MVYSYKEIKKILGSNYQINKKIDNKELYKIIDGIYSEEELVDPIIVYTKKYPNSIITMDSAFYYYDLTDVIPNKTHIATNMHAYMIKDENIIQYFISDKLLNIGKTQINLNDEIVNIYDKERLLIELIRRRNNVSYDYYKEIINNYRNISYKLKMNKLEQYLESFSNGEYILDIIQREVL